MHCATGSHDNPTLLLGWTTDAAAAKAAEYIAVQRTSSNAQNSSHHLQHQLVVGSQALAYLIMYLSCDSLGKAGNCTPDLLCRIETTAADYDHAS